MNSIEPAVVSNAVPSDPNEPTTPRPVTSSRKMSSCRSDDAATTPGLDDEDRALVRERVAAEIAETYPRFAATLLAA